MADTMADSDITSRGLLMLRLIPTFFTVVLVTLDTLDTTPWILWPWTRIR